MTSDRPLPPIIEYEPGATSFPVWRCPVCGFANLRGAGRCQNKRYADGPMIPTLKPGEDLEQFPRPKEVLEHCDYVRPCERCGQVVGQLRAIGYLCAECADVKIKEVRSRG